MFKVFCSLNANIEFRALVGILRLGVKKFLGYWYLLKLEFLGRNSYLLSKSKNVGGAITVFTFFKFQMPLSTFTELWLKLMLVLRRRMKK